LRGKPVAVPVRPADAPEAEPPPSTVTGWWSEPFDAPDWNDGLLSVRAKPVEEGQGAAGAEMLGHFNFKVIEANESPEGGQLTFSTEYRLLLTTEGELMVFVGPEPPYWEVTGLAEWDAAEPGCVLRVPMTHGDQRIDDETDPFSGIH
jgi:hypothetical protein